jgi:hypothetical protein
MMSIPGVKKLSVISPTVGPAGQSRTAQKIAALPFCMTVDAEIF